MQSRTLCVQGIFKVESFILRGCGTKLQLIEDVKKYKYGPDFLLLLTTSVLNGSRAHISRLIPCWFPPRC